MGMVPVMVVNASVRLWGRLIEKGWTVYDAIGRMTATSNDGTFLLSVKTCTATGNDGKKAKGQARGFGGKGGG